MCDRIGCTHFPKLQDMDFSGRAVASRRRFLKGAAAVTTISMGLGGGFAGTAHAASTLKSTHGSGFCNLNIFLAHARQYAKAWGVEL
ncbi:MAG: twin-arginine translocation signal domain-containing protein, partial [Rhodospirillaceae bacterium]